MKKVIEISIEEDSEIETVVLAVTQKKDGKHTTHTLAQRFDGGKHTIVLPFNSDEIIDGKEVMPLSPDSE